MAFELGAAIGYTRVHGTRDFSHCPWLCLVRQLHRLRRAFYPHRTSLPLEPPPAPDRKPSDSPSNNRDLLLHLEAYLARRDGVDKLLKISWYASKVILSSSALLPDDPLAVRLKRFESSVGLSRKAFPLGKFVQDVNSLKASQFESKQEITLTVIAYGGEGVYYFVEQFVWLAKAGLIDKGLLPNLKKISAWAEFVRYAGSTSLKIKELKGIREDEACLVSSIEIAVSRGTGHKEEAGRLKKLREKKLMKTLSTVQDVADGLMALADIRDGRGKLSGPLLLSCAGLLSALISTHKNWISC